MSLNNYDKILAWTGLSEGGFTNNRKDPGNWSTGKVGKGDLLGTNHGITGRTLQQWRGAPVTMEDVRNLTKSEADEIYKSQYWDAVKGDQLPSGIDYAVFDFGVNSGPVKAIKSLQEVLDVTPDGFIGADTLNALDTCNKPVVINNLCVGRLKFMKGLSNWHTFKNGWTTRVMGNHAGVQTTDIGVIDRATMLYQDAGTDIQEPTAISQGKADPNNTSQVTKWMTPDGLSKAGMAVSGLGGMLSGTGPIQYALALVFVIAACVAGYIVIKSKLDA